MPILFERTPGQSHFVARWQGPISDQVLLDSYIEFYQSPAWEPGLHEIADQREADMSGVSAAALHRLADFVRRHFEQHQVLHSRTAVVCGTGLHFGLSRIYEAWATESAEELQLFYAIDEAEAWLRSGEESRRAIGE